MPKCSTDAILPLNYDFKMNFAKKWCTYSNKLFYRYFAQIWTKFCKSHALIYSCWKFLKMNGDETIISRHKIILYVVICCTSPTIFPIISPWQGSFLGQLIQSSTYNNSQQGIQQHTGVLRQTCDKTLNDDNLNSLKFLYALLDNMWDMMKSV